MKGGDTTYPPSNLEVMATGGAGSPLPTSRVLVEVATSPAGSITVVVVVFTLAILRFLFSSVRCKGGAEGAVVEQEGKKEWVGVVAAQAWRWRSAATVDAIQAARDPVNTAALRLRMARWK